MLTLSTDTEPRIIKREQRRDIRLAIERFGDIDPRFLSQCVILPVWVVRQRLTEMGHLKPEPKRDNSAVMKCERGKAKPIIVKLLRKNGEMTVAQLREATGLQANTIRHAMESDRATFTRRLDLTNMRRRGKSSIWWGLK